MHLYDQPARRQAFFTAILGEVGSLQGVGRAGATTHLPILDPGKTWRTWSPDRPRDAGHEGERTYLRRVSPGYFATMNMPVLRGRDLSETDRDGAPAVAVLSESLARRLFPQGDPIGRTVLLHDNLTRPPKDLPYQIVGIVRSARLADARDDGDPALYLSILQASPARWQRGLPVPRCGAG